MQLFSLQQQFMWRSQKVVLRTLCGSKVWNNNNLLSNIFQQLSCLYRRTELPCMEVRCTNNHILMSSYRNQITAILKYGLVHHQTQMNLIKQKYINHSYLITTPNIPFLISEQPSLYLWSKDNSFYYIILTLYYYLWSAKSKLFLPNFVAYV